ncbi:acyl-CoA thioesterase [Celeribacter sp. ULVN23_4]
MSDTPKSPEQPPVLITVAPYDQVTPRGYIFGGWIMAQIDHAAGLAGRKIAEGDVMIVSVKEMDFLGPLAPGEEFVMHAELTRRGNSSFTLSLSATAEPHTEARPVMRANVTLVAVDASGKPRKLPELVT